MFNLGEIGAAVTLDDSDFNATLGTLEARTTAVFKKIGGIAAGLFGLKQIAEYAKKAVAAYSVQEDAVNSLDRALALVGQSGYSAELQKIASELQRITIYGDEVTIAAMAMGVNMGISADKMEDATKAAMGLASAYRNLDIHSAMQLVARAANGNTAMLQRYAIEVDKNKTKQEQFNELLKKGNELFALAEAQTFGQKLQQVRNAVGDLNEAVGEFILTLFDVDYASGDVADKIAEVTASIQDNLEKWVFEIKYVLAYIEAGVKNVYAMIEPVVSFVSDVFSSAAKNIISIGQWVFDNMDKLVDGFPLILAGVFEDIVILFVNLGKTLVNLAANFGKAIWDALTGDGFGGFEKMLDQFVSDARKTFYSVGDAVSAAMEYVGVSAFPELQGPNYKAVVDKYSNLSETFAAIDRERQEKQAKEEERLIERLNKKRSRPDNQDKTIRDAVESTKNNVAGSFSASVLSGMIGANAPEKETAKNTRQMVEQQKETNRELKKSKKDKYT